MTVDQIDYLLILSGAFLALVFVNGGFKFYVNVFRGQLGERMLGALGIRFWPAFCDFHFLSLRKLAKERLFKWLTPKWSP